MYHRRPNDDDPPHRKLAKQNNEAEDPPPLLIVPPDVLYLILAHLSRRDMTELRSVCRLMNQRIAPVAKAWLPLRRIESSDIHVISFKLKHHIQPLDPDPLSTILPVIFDTEAGINMVGRWMQLADPERRREILQKAIRAHPRKAIRYLSVFLREDEDFDTVMEFERGVFRYEDRFLDFLLQFPDKLSVAKERYPWIIPDLARHLLGLRDASAWRIFYKALPSEIPNMKEYVQPLRHDIISYAASEYGLQGFDATFVNSMSTKVRGKLYGVDRIGNTIIIDDFKVDPGVRVIDGPMLSLTDMHSPDIFGPHVNLDGVKDLSIRDCWMPHLRGLTRLRGEMKCIYLAQNSMLSDLRGLDNVTSIDTLKLEENTKLKSLDGLQGVTMLGAIFIRENSVLDNIEALSNVRVDSTRPLITIDILANPRLSSLNGLSGITGRIARLNIGGLLIYKTSIGNIDSLSAVTRVAGLLAIKYTHLQTLDALRAIDSVEGNSVFIESNCELLSLDALIKQLHVDQDVTVSWNSKLKSIEADGLYVGQILTISNNDVLTVIKGSFTAQSIEICGHRSLTTLILSETNRLANLKLKSNFILTSIQPITTTARMNTISITDNNLLLATPGFPVLTEVNNFGCHRNGSMTSIGAIPMLARMSNLYICSCPRLTSLKGLETLGVVSQALHVDNNDNLETLEGLNGLREVTELSITRCGSLSDYTALLGLTEVTRCHFDIMPRALLSHFSLICDSISYDEIVDDIRAYRGPIHFP